MSVAHAQALRLRLFVEGIELPVISVQVTCAPNSPAVAVIQIPPLSAATKFHPRSMVHLFFLDLYRNSPAISTSPPTGSADRGDNSPSLSDRVLLSDHVRTEEEFKTVEANLNNDSWKLLFGGEVVGFSWTKTSSQRSVVLQCEDWSNYWDYAFQADNTDLFGPGIKAIFSGASTNLFTDFLSSKGSAITGIVSSGKCNTFPKLKGLAAGIVRLIEAIGGSYYSYPSADNKPAKTYAGQNIFFSYAELRVHLTQMVGTLEEDPTGTRILKRQGYSGMFDRLLGGQGGQVSIRQAINALTKVIFYEMYPQSCPFYRPGTFGEPSGVRRVKLKDHPVFGKFATVAENVAQTLELSTDTLLSYSEADLSIPAVSEALRAAAVDQTTLLQGVLKQLRQARAQMRGIPDSVSKAFTTAAQAVAKAVHTVATLRAVGAASATTVVKRLTTATEYLNTGVTAMQGVEDAVALLGSGRDRFPAQLYQQVFKPDTWFSAPIRCNVLFPENYNTMTYQRMFLQEPTRFLLKTNDEFYGEDELFDHMYFAPKGATVKGDKLSMRSVLKRDVLLHERFTGILPIFEKMGEFNIFASRAEPKDQRTGIKKVGLAQRSTNFLYFRHRFNARRMEVEGKFNPYIAVGFPGLVIDKYVDQATIDRHNELRRELSSQDPGGRRFPTLELSEILGTNFLGNFTQVVHHVAQDQPVGRTSVTVTFPRQPDETVEYLGAIPEEQRVQQRLTDADALRSTDVAAIDAPAPFSLGPNGGQITNVQDVTQMYTLGFTTPKTLPLFFGGSRRESIRPPDVPIGVPVAVGTLGSNVVVQEVGGNPNTIVGFRAFRVTEKIPRYRRESALLPPEEYIRPGWYGNRWTNANISTVYQELMGTGSITEPQTINDFGRNTFNLRSEEAQQAANTEQEAENADDPKKDAPAIVDLQEGASIQDAVEFLHLTYSYIRQAGLDVDEFLAAYNWRPIASMLDIFGTSDLTYSEGGEEVLSGFEGFHSRAIGPYENLFGLVNAEMEKITGIARGSTAALNIDTRLAKREQVEKYVAQLLFSNAILG